MGPGPEGVLEISLPLWFIVEESEQNAYQEILESLGIEMDSRCIGKLVLHTLMAIANKIEMIKDIKENERSIQELIGKMDSVYECRDMEKYGVVISPNPGIKPLNERGAKIIKIIEKNIIDTIKRYVRLRLAPLIVKSIKSESDMALTLEHAFNAIPIALELINGPILRVRIDPKEVIE